MVALAPESVVEETPAVVQETDAAPEMDVEERKAHIITLVADGKRDLFAAEYESASEKLGDAAGLSAEIFGDFAPESFDANLYYGRALLEIARSEEQILKTAMTDIPEGDEINDSVNEQVESIDKLTDDQKDEIKEQVDGALQENTELLETPISAEATSSETAVEVEEDKAAEATTDKTEDVPSEQAEKLSSVEQSTEVNAVSEETNDEDTETADEEKEDMEVEDEELTTMQTAWEILEVARNICDKQDETEEWNLKKAEVLLTLGELSLEDENYKQAIDDLHMCLALHLKHRKNSDRAVAEVYITIARAHSLNDDYENAEKYYAKTREALEGNLAALKEGEPSEDTLKEIATVEELITEVNGKIEDAQQSGKQIQKDMGDIREKLGLGQAAVTLQAKSSEPAGDITNLVRRKGEKRAAVGDAEEAKKPKTDDMDSAPPVVADC